MLRDHDEEVTQRLDKKYQKHDYAEFTEKLQAYEKDNFFKLRGVCKEAKKAGNFAVLPNDMILELSKYIPPYKPTLAGENTEAMEVDMA
jgi:hypothetical protein